MNSQNNSRRTFVKMAFAASGVAFILPSLLSAQEKRRAKPGAAGGGDLALPWAKPGVGMAANLNYQEKHEAIKDAALKIDRQGVKFNDQQCSKCMLYTKVGNKDGVEAGKCTLLNENLVKSTSWCASWSKKA